jgi:hypothetical protein
VGEACKNDSPSTSPGPLKLAKTLLSENAFGADQKQDFQIFVGFWVAPNDH